MLTLAVLVFFGLFSGSIGQTEPGCDCLAIADQLIAMRDIVIQSFGPPPGTFPFDVLDNDVVTNLACDVLAATTYQEIADTMQMPVVEVQAMIQMVKEQINAGGVEQMQKRIPILKYLIPMMDDMGFPDLPLKWCHGDILEATRAFFTEFGDGVLVDLFDEHQMDLVNPEDIQKMTPEGLARAFAGAISLDEVAQRLGVGIDALHQLMTPLRSLLNADMKPLLYMEAMINLVKTVSDCGFFDKFE